MKLIGSIILSFLFIQSIKGQELYGNFLSQERGLLSDECYDINYDPKGYLIVGTEYGPMKFNGEKFIPICTNLSMDRRVMYDFEKGPDGRIFLLNSKNEFFTLQNDKAVKIAVKNASKFHVRNLSFLKLHATDGGLYILASNRYLKYSFKTNRFYRIPDIKNPSFIFSYNSKKKFPFTKFVGSFVPTTYVNFEFTESSQRFRFEKTMAFDSREDQIKVGNSTYILMCTKVFKKRGNLVIPLDFGQVLFMEHFHSRIWLCTYNGLIELDTEGKLIHHHFKGEVIGGVIPLKSGGIAVSFNRKGVFISTNINDRVHTNFTASAANTFKGMNLVGSADGLLYKYSDNKFEKVLDAPPKINKLLPNTANDGVSEVSTYKDSLLVTYIQGACFYSPDFKLIKDFRHFAYTNFGQFSYKENIFYIGRSYIIRNSWKGLNTLSFPYQYKFFRVKDIRCHARLNDSTMILGTKTGLVKFDLKTNEYSRSYLLKKQCLIAGIHVLENGTTFIFTRFDGIYIAYKNKIIRKIAAPCISIASALFYRDQLVVRGNDGIYIKPFRSRKNNWFKVFNGKSENLFILDNSLLIASKNDLLTKKLANYRSIYKPEIVLNKFQLGNVGFHVFPHTIPSNKSISVDLDILQFDANKLGLYYTLQGKNTISQQIEGTKINFDALKSGSYVLKIHPVIDGKIQFNNSKTFRFTIEETFWESTVFYILSGILILSIVVTSVLVIHLRRRKRKAERSELESRLNEYKLLAVKAQVNPHFLSNGLAAIQALILKEDNDLAAQYLAKFSFLMRKTLYYSEKQFITVKQEMELVDTYLELELLRFRNRFRIRREIKLSESQLEKFQFPSLLLQPILENAIWHGLKFQENNPELGILFEINQNNELFVRISDNGPGFNESNKSEEHLSKGNQLITDRIDTLNKQFQKNVASMEVISSPSGTSVTFIFHPEVFQPAEP